LRGLFRSEPLSLVFARGVLMIWADCFVFGFAPFRLGGSASLGILFVLIRVLFFAFFCCAGVLSRGAIAARGGLEVGAVVVPCGCRVAVCGPCRAPACFWDCFPPFGAVLAVVVLRPVGGCFWFCCVFFG